MSPASNPQPQAARPAPVQPVTTKPRPVYEIRFGRIVAAVWENRTEQGVRHNVTICRIYKSEDQWKETQSFGRDDLPVACKVLDRCHTWIYEQSGSSPSGS